MMSTRLILTFVVACIATLRHGALACESYVPEPCDCTHPRSNDYDVLCNRKGLSALPSWPNDSALAGTDRFTLVGNFSRNSITALTPGYFSQLRFLRLDFSHNRIGGVVSGESFVGLEGSLTILDLSGNFISDVQGFDGMLSLTKLNVSQNQITDICQWHILRLETLNVAENAISSLGPGCFGEMPEVSSLDLAGNGLRHVDPLAFDQAEDLVNVRFDNNPLADVATAIGGLDPRTLTRLSLANVGLRSLGPFCGRSADGSTVTGALYDKMEYLSLADNSITRLEEFCFRKYAPATVGAPQTPLEMTVEGNMISDIDGDAFNGLDGRLNKLFLGRNRIFDVGKSFHKLQRLVELNMDDNRMVSLSDICDWSSTRLETLSLAYNRIEQIPENCFTNKPALKVLSLGYNRLVSLPDSRVSGLAQLSKLDLTRNIVSDISNKAFEGLSRLTELRLSGNALTTLKYCSFKDLQNLILFYYDDNLLHCDCQMSWLPAYTSGVKSRSSTSTVPLEKDHCRTPQNMRGFEIDLGAGVPFGCPTTQPPCSSSRFTMETVLDVYDTKHNATLVVVPVWGAGESSGVVTVQDLDGDGEKVEEPVGGANGPNVTVNFMNASNVYHVCLSVSLSGQTTLDCRAWPEKLKDPWVAPPPPTTTLAGGQTSTDDSSATAAIVLAVILIIVVIVAAVIIVLMWRRMNGYEPPRSSHLTNRDSRQPISSVQSNGNGSNERSKAPPPMSYTDMIDENDSEPRNSVETLMLRGGHISSV